MDEFQRIKWLNKLELLGQQAEDDDIHELTYIFGIVYAAIDQGQLSRLKSEYTKFSQIRIKELEEDLKKLENQMGDAIIGEIQEIISSPHEDFKLKNEHDDHYPFDEDSEEDPHV